MKWLNSNFIHNVLNAAIVVNSAVLYLGCSVDAAGVASCSKATFIPPMAAVIIIGLSGILKFAINLGRDGLAGLAKMQPPVADAMTTVVQPTAVLTAGQKVTVTATTTATKKA